MKNSYDDVINRKQLLERYLKKPKDVPNKIKTAIKSQGALAAMSFEEFNIHPLALNTLKSDAERFLENGGWNSLDRLRKELKQCVQNTKIRKASAEIKVNKSNREYLLQIEEMHRVRLRLEQAYLSLLRICKMSSNYDSKIKNELDRHIQSWNLELGLSLAKVVENG